MIVIQCTSMSSNVTPVTVKGFVSQVGHKTILTWSTQFTFQKPFRIFSSKLPRHLVGDKPKVIEMFVENGMEAAGIEFSMSV